MRRNLAVSFVIASLATALAAETNNPGWGTSSESFLSIGAFAFQPADTTTGYTTYSSGARGITTGTEYWFASLSLPTGAVVSGFELQGCDESTTGELTLTLFRSWIAGVTDGVTQEAPIFQTGIAATPGCSHFPMVLPVPVEIDNADGMYLVRVQQVSTTGGLLRFVGVRVRYKLQVSPAPGVATFADVPVGHQQFRFIEALFASGITAGCGGGNFCPDAPVTRGQMAVFLSAALGLHFPN